MEIIYRIASLKRWKEIPLTQTWPENRPQRGRFHKWCYSKWRVYEEQSPENRWFGGSPIYGNPQLGLYREFEGDGAANHARIFMYFMWWFNQPLTEVDHSTIDVFRLIMLLVEANLHRKPMGVDMFFLSLRSWGFPVIQWLKVCQTANNHRFFRTSSSRERVFVAAVWLNPHDVCVYIYIVQCIILYCSFIMCISTEM